MCVKCEVWEGYAGCGKSVVSAVCVGCTACELRVAWTCERCVWLSVCVAYENERKATAKPTES